MSKNDVELKEVTRENWVSCARIKLAPEQVHLVAPAVDSIAQSHFETHHKPRAIYANGNVVGLLVYAVETDPPDPTLFWLFRFMIDIEHQSKGYGTKAIRLAILEMKKAGAHRIRTMHKQGNEAASRVYNIHGFTKIGMLDDGDVELELIVQPT